MPSDRDKRITVRFSEEGFALVELAAKQANLAVAGLVRECAERYAFQVARDRLAGKAVHIRAANGSPRERSYRAERERREAREAERLPSRVPVSGDEAFRLAAARRVVRP